MLQVPLLSEAYAAALFHEDPPQPAACPEPEPRALATPQASVPGEEEDLETAPTRPLRLDQVRL